MRGIGKYQQSECGLKSRQGKKFHKTKIDQESFVSRSKKRNRTCKVTKYIINYLNVLFLLSMLFIFIRFVVHSH